MGNLKQSFTMLYLGLGAAVYLKPEYAINSSRIVTLVILFAIIVVSKFVYNVFLYPQFFTPLKGIPAPSVSLSITSPQMPFQN